MEHQDSSSETYKKFTWKIENFSRLTVIEKWSDSFRIGGHPWRITLFPKGNMYKGAVNDLSIYLESMLSLYMTEGWTWTKDVKFKLVVFNQLNTNRTITKASINTQFTPSQKSWGCHSFMSLAELHDPNNGFIVNDVCIVGVEVCVCKSRYEKPLNPTEHMKVGRFDASNPEFVHAAFGKVICFLNTRKVKDMDERGCKLLQLFWNELQKLKYDLSWLEPHVQSALGMKSFVEKAIQVEKLKENLVVQELETERLKTKLVAAELNLVQKAIQLEKLKENLVVQELEIERLKTKLVAAEVNLDAERNLLKAKGLKVVDLDSELGCGSWRLWIDYNVFNSLPLRA